MIKAAMALCLAALWLIPSSGWQPAVAGSPGGKRCTVVSEVIGGNAKPACLVLRMSGHHPFLSREVRIAFHHITVDWWYQCPKHMRGAGFHVGFDEWNGDPYQYGQQIFSGFIVRVDNQSQGSGRARRRVAKAADRIGFWGRAGSLQPKVDVNSCSWRIRVTGDDY